MSDPRDYGINPHSMHEAMDQLLKALKEGRLVAYDGDDGDPLPGEYWTDKTTAALARPSLRIKKEDAMRVWPAKGEEA